MAKVKKQPLTDPDEEKLAQDIAKVINEDDAYYTDPDDLALIEEAEIDDSLGWNPDDGDDIWQTRLFAQRLKPYSLEERKRIHARVTQLSD